ncbi:unnamed protein product [Urochloa humidicola]
MSSRNRSAAAPTAPPRPPPLLLKLRRRLSVRRGGCDGGRSRRRAGASAREKAREVSVRKLAAGVWRLRPTEAVAGAAAAAGGAERRVRVGVEVCVQLFTEVDLTAEELDWVAEGLDSAGRGEGRRELRPCWLAVL